MLAGVKSREGDVVPVGVTIAWIVAPGEQPPAESALPRHPARKMTEQPRHATSADSGACGKRLHSEGGARISPKARRLAKERGVDISRIRGTGPDGTITSEDVLAAAAGLPAAAAPQRRRRPRSATSPG